jgi:hypothetical protein
MRSERPSPKAHCAPAAAGDRQHTIPARRRADFIDPRTGRNSQFPLADLFRQSIYSPLAGYEDTNDAERLADGPYVSDAGVAGAARHERRAHVHVALVRDRCPCGGAELPRTDSLEHGPGSRGGGAIAPPTRDARHRQLREPGPWDAGAVRVQRALRVRLLPPALRLQPRGRLPGGKAPAGQRPQCGRVG